MTTQPSFDLTGKVAIVTGASKGIGEAIAYAYATAGASVVVSSRKQEALDQVAAGIREAGGQALAVAAHTGSAEAVENLVQRAVEAFGGVDIAVNNAATNPHFGPLLSAEESMWDKTVDVNLKGYARLAKAVVPLMKERGGGKIINVASVAGIKPAPLMGLYGITKAGVIMMTRVLANELAADNIQVNAIAPGFIRTKFTTVIWSTDQLRQAVEKATPQGRIGSVEEVTGIAVYLASPASSFTTGGVFVVDGGLSESSGMSFG